MPAYLCGRLHETNIRYEASCYTLIAQLVSVYDVSSEGRFDVPALPRLYMCGDVHCLPPAWQVVPLKTGPRVIVPSLVTGCKIWHLREESSFYTKSCFERVTQAFAPGSHVVFVFGEIDCREGVGLAAERCRCEVRMTQWYMPY
jgi:hypothetical protein